MEYVGAFKNNKKCGKGRFKYEDGRCYKGDFLDDIKHGEGEYTWLDKRKYFG